MREQKTLRKLTERAMCRDIGSQLWCITCVLPPETLVVRNDSLSTGTVSLMVVFTVLSTGALSGANGSYLLPLSSTWILQGCFCSVFCFSSAAVLHIPGEERSCLCVRASHLSAEKSSAGICSFSFRLSGHSGAVLIRCALQGYRNACGGPIST